MTVGASPPVIKKHHTLICLTIGFDPQIALRAPDKTTIEFHEISANSLPNGVSTFYRRI
jgi:hypothetical protein